MSRGRGRPERAQRGTKRRGGQKPARAPEHPLSGTSVELAIDALALGGAGVGRMPEGREGAGMAVFVPGALPGSGVEARLTQVHRRHAEAVLTRVLTPSPDETVPACPHFRETGEACGGCALQHLAPERQLYWKERQLLEALRRIGKVEPGRVLPPVPAPAAYGFRNKMEFAFQGAGQGLKLGLHARSAGDEGPGRVLDLSCCRLFPEAGFALVDAARAKARAAGLAAFDRKSGEGLLRHLVLRHSVAQNAYLAQLITAPASEAQARAVQELGAALLAGQPLLAGFVHAERSGRDPLAQAERTRLTLGAASLEERLGPVRYAVSADAFFQTSTGGALALYSALAQLAAPAANETVYDLYCGGGGIALFLAGSAGRVLGLEQNPAAVADAEANAELNGIANCRFLRAELAGDPPLPERLPEGFGAPDLVLADPPREGLDAGVAAWLCRQRPARLAYVSCNPATLARDAGILSQAFALSAVRAVDLFPHSAHVEALALFEPL